MERLGHFPDSMKEIECYSFMLPPSIGSKKPYRSSLKMRIEDAAQRHPDGRTVARVICAGTDANAEQVRDSIAWAFTKYLTDPAIARLEQRARAARVGLWQDVDAVAPWVWRAERKEAVAQRAAGKKQAIGG